MTIKYKESTPGWFKKIDIATGQTMAEFNKKNSFLFDEMQSWKYSGGKIEPEFTPEEILEKEKELKSNLLVSLKSEFKKRITQSDKIATLLAIGDNYLDITLEQLLNYKQELRSCYNALSIDSPLEELQNPSWPEKLTDKELL